MSNHSRHSNRQTITNQLRSGLPDPRIDTFSDVKRALHIHAMINFPEARKRSEQSTARNLARFAEKYAEEEN
jgi:hypothetical protein